MEAGWQGEYVGAAALRAAGLDLLQHAQDHHLRRLQRSAAQHRRADGAGLMNASRLDPRPWISGIRGTMDFDFSDDQEQLRDAVASGSTRATASSAAAPSRRPAASTATPMANWPNSAWPASTSPKTHGGMGMGPVEGMVVMEELGRGIVLEPLAPDPDRRRRAGRLCARRRQVSLAAEDRRRRGAGGAGLPGAQGALSARRLRGQGHAGRRRLDASPAPRASCPPATRPTPSWCRPGQRQDRAVPGRAQRRRRRRPAATARRTAAARPK